jgi:hypothetical protein
VLAFSKFVHAALGWPPRAEAATVKCDIRRFSSDIVSLRTSNAARQSRPWFGKDAESHSERQREKSLFAGVAKPKPEAATVGRKWDTASDSNAHAWMTRQEDG